MRNIKLEELCTNLIHLQYEEESYAEMRKKCELEIAAMLTTKDEGTDKAEVGRFRVTVTNKLNRTLDYEAYLAVEPGLPEGVRCVDLKPSINLKKLRALEMVDPALPAQFILTRAGKASVKLEVIDGN